jgi:hypothetical protein
MAPPKAHGVLSPVDEPEIDGDVAHIVEKPAPGEGGGQVRLNWRRDRLQDQNQCHQSHILELRLMRPSVADAWPGGSVNRNATSMNPDKGERLLDGEAGRQGRTALRFASAMAAAAALVVGIAQVSAAARQQEHAQHLGVVHFATSCNEPAQQHFDRAMRYQHSFWYSASKVGFEEALEADPSCAIAYWGIAQSLMANPFNPTPAPNLTAGQAAIAQARRVGAKTPRENDLIAAAGVFYADFDTLDQRTRSQAYAKAMKEVAERYPADDEVQIYYALALDMSAPPTDKSYANQLEAAAILEPILRRQPSHPGAAHYLIHTYDYPGLAGKGLDAALRYAAIAEAAPHAQHMPSHIFTRVGYWKESVAANSAAARLARAGREQDDELHASDYMVYGYLQMGRDTEARAILERMAAVTGYNAERNTGPFAIAASAARYLVERSAWQEAAQLPLRPSKFPYADAITHFARALGAARSGATARARSDVETLVELRDRLRAAKDVYWAEQVDIQRQVASAWLLHAGNQPDAALEAMRLAAEAEDRTEKATVTPGPLAPARELYGAMLLERGKASEALAAFEATMAREPNRFNGLAGAARAAQLSGNDAKARTYSERLVELTSGASVDRPEVVAAKQFLAARRK